MNRKQLLTILAAVIVIGGLGLWSRQRRLGSFKTTEGRMGQKALGEFDINAIARVSIKHATNEVNLVRRDDLWTVQERGAYPANFSEVGELLRKLWDLKVVQSPQVGSSQLARLELTPPDPAGKGGTLLELKDANGKTVKSLLLGKKHMRKPETPSPMGGDEGWPDGRYLLVDNQPQSVSLVSETFANVEPKADQWLNKDFFKVEKVKSVAVAYPAATNSWKLARETETGDMKLLDAKPEEKIDTAKTSALNSALSYPSFNDVVADPKPDVTGLDKPTVVVLETFDHFTYTVKVGNKSADDNYYLTVAVAADIPKSRTPGKDEKPEDKDKLDKEFKEKTDKLNEKLKQEQSYAKSTYIVSKWTLDSVLKERHALMAEKKEEEKKAEAAGTPGTPPPPAMLAAPKTNPPMPPTLSDLVPSVLPPAPPAPKADAPPKPEDKKDPDKP